MEVHSGNSEVELQKLSEVIGLPVVCVDSGKKVGIVKDVIFCPTSKGAKAFLLDKRSYETGQKIILFENVASLGNDAVIIDNMASIHRMKEMEEKEQLNDRADVLGMKVYSKAGKDLGVVRDVLFDYRTGYIEGVEISDGIFQDILQGRNILPIIGNVEFGEENILAGNDAIEEMITTGGGIKNMLGR